MAKVKILMVCLGNICRSPLAEGILASMSSNVSVDSAGTSAYHRGELPDKRSITIAKKHNINITNQRSRQFEISDFDRFDTIYAMDNMNYSELVKLARNKKDKDKIKLILNEIKPHLNQDIPDPYYDRNNGFEEVFSMLFDCCTVIASKLEKHDR